MKLPSFTRIILEDLSTQAAKLVGPIVAPLNNFMLTIKNGLDKGLTINDNLSGALKIVTTTNNTVNLSYPSNRLPKAVILGGWTDTTDGSWVPKAGFQVSFTAATTDVCTSYTHGLRNGEKVQLASTGTIPTGLTIGIYYYVQVLTADTFKLALTPTGTPIDITGTGSGTHYVVTPNTTGISLSWYYSQQNIYVTFYGLEATHKYSVSLVIFDD